MSFGKQEVNLNESQYGASSLLCSQSILHVIFNRFWLGGYDLTRARPPSLHQKIDQEALRAQWLCGLLMGNERFSDIQAKLA
jgi:hypothetical protein